MHEYLLLGVLCSLVVFIFNKEMQVVLSQSETNTLIHMRLHTQIWKYENDSLRFRKDEGKDFLLGF